MHDNPRKPLRLGDVEGVGRKRDEGAEAHGAHTNPRFSVVCKCDLGDELGIFLGRFSRR